MNVEKLKNAVREVLPSVDVVIGYRAGGDPLARGAVLHQGRGAWSTR